MVSQQDEILIMADFKKTIEQHPIGAVATAVASTIVVMYIVFNLIFTGILQKKDAIIELQDREMKVKDDSISTYVKRFERDSLMKVELSSKVKSLELALGKSAQKKILSNTILCPSKGISIFDGNAIVSYWNYAEPANIAQVTIIAEGKLQITDADFYLDEPRRESFTVNKQEYVFNFLGFDQERGKGCIKISIYKK